MSRGEFTKLQVRLWMPTPPTTNALFSDHGGFRAKSREYEAWKKQAAQEIMIQRPLAIAGKVMLDFFHGARSVVADCSNYIKAAEDLLVEMRLIEGDNAKCVQRVSSCWVPHFLGTVVHITPVQDADMPWLGFDAGVLGRKEASPASDYTNVPQTLGKIRRRKTGEAWTSKPGETGRSRADVRMAAKRKAKPS